MIKGGCGFCFLNKAAHSVLIRGHLSTQHLQSDNPFEPRVLSEIHLSHTTGPDLVSDLVTSKDCASSNAHIEFKNNSCVLTREQPWRSSLVNCILPSSDHQYCLIR